jgi:DNA-binding MarR family transcriptional regulator
MASNSELLELYSSLRRNISLEATFSLKELGFSLRQFLILRNLGRRGPLTMTILAEHCMTDAATISRSVSQLIEQQYARKLQCPEDGRVFRAELTAKGAKLLPELDRLHGELADQCFGHLSAEEKKLLTKTLKKVVEYIEAGRAPAAAGEGA